MGDALSPFDYAVTHCECHWDVLDAGWRNGWVSRDRLGQYAERLLVEDRDDGDPDIAMLALPDIMSDLEIEALLQSRLSGADPERAMDMWRLAFLEEIRLSNDSEAEKTRQLEKVYGRFFYPADMDGCSADDAPDARPLTTMLSVIRTLKADLLG